MRKNADILCEAIPLIKQDEKNMMYFFSKAKSPDWFIPLLQNDLFNSNSIPIPLKSENGFTFSNWPQQYYLECLSKLICDGEVSDAETVEAFISVLRSIENTNENFLLARALFLCMMRIPSKHLACADVELAFSWIKKCNTKGSLMESSVHEGFSLIVSSLSNANNERSFFKIFISELFTCSPNGKDSKDEKLMFFSDYGFNHFRNSHFDVQYLAVSKPFLLLDMLDVLTSELSNLLNGSELDDTTQHWRPAVESHHQNKFHDSAQSLLVGLIGEIGLALRSKNIPIPMLISWKDSHHFTFKRIYFTLMIDESQQTNREQAARKIIEIGLSSKCRHEIFLFLSRQFEYLETDTKNDILNLISAIATDYRDTQYLNNRYNAWEKLRWLEALSNSKQQRVIDMRKELLVMTEGKVPEHPDFSSYMSATWIGPTSPLHINELAKCNPEEIFERLQTFEHSNELASPSISGFARVLEDFIGTDPIKISSLVTKIDQLDFHYISAILNGYSKAWGEKKYVPLQDLVLKLLGLVFSNSFELAMGDPESKAHWVVNSLCNFIESGTKSDTNAFPKKFNGKLHSILRQCLKISPPDRRFASHSDAYSRAINETRGRIFGAMIILSLRRARTVKRDSVSFKKSWDDLRNTIEPILKLQNNDEISLHALLGAYYPQFLFLDKHWFVSNIDTIVPFPSSNLTSWLGFMQGFSYVTNYDKDVYDLLKIKGHLLAYLRFEGTSPDNNGRSDRLQNRIIELGLVALILGHETLNEGIISSVIEQKNEDEWNRMLWSINSIIGEKPDPDHLAKAKGLIDKLIALKEGGALGEGWQSFFKGLSRFLEHLGNPSEPLVSKIFKIVAADRQSPWELGDLIEYLHQFRDSHTRSVGVLFTELLNSSDTAPSWPPDKVRDICQSLASQPETEILIKICRIYSERSVTCEPIMDICSNLV